MLLRTLRYALYPLGSLLVLSACSQEQPAPSPSLPAAAPSTGGAAPMAPAGPVTQPGAPSASVSSVSDPAVGQALVLRRQHNLDGAIDVLKKALANHPDDIGLNRAYQDAMRAASKTAEAKTEYANRLKAQPGSALAQYLYGRSVIAEAPQEAEGAFRKAIQLDPGFQWAYLGLGTLHDRAADNFAAIQTYEDALKLFPNSPEVYFNLGNSLNVIGALPKALEAAERATRLRPDFAEAHELAGKISFQQKDFSNARSSVEKALSLEPELPAANLIMAQLLAEQGEIEKSKAFANRAAQLGQSLPPALKTRLQIP